MVEIEVKVPAFWPPTLGLSSLDVSIFDLFLSARFARVFSVVFFFMTVEKIRNFLLSQVVSNTARRCCCSVDLISVNAERYSWFLFVYVANCVKVKP